MGASEGEYLGMPVAISELDAEQKEFYRLCSTGALHLQRCLDCELLRYPPTTACPWCSSPQAGWVPVSGRGTVYSYGEVHHAIQPAFRKHTPYLLLLVELDEQQDVPVEHAGLRVTGNLADEAGELASPDLVASVGIGTRVKVVFKRVGDEIAMPLWAVDGDADMDEAPWRYPE